MNFRIKILLAGAAATFLFACKDEVKVLSQEKCAEIIFEMHKADAIINIKGWYDRNLNNDSLSYYNYVFKKANISRLEFTQSINYYVDHPKQYKEIYNLVMQKLSEQEKSIGGTKDNFTKKENDVWNQKRSYNLPLDGSENPIAYKIETDKHGVYTLSAKMCLYSDDGTQNPRMTIIARYTDDTYDENSNNGFRKDGQSREISVQIKTNGSKKLKSIEGWVLDQSNETENKHSDVKNIELLYDKD